MTAHTTKHTIRDFGSLESLPGKMPSKVTQSLISQLVQRDAHGQQKYGTSLDRKDLTLEQWLQHQVEELLDGAGYASAALRELKRMNQEYALLRQAVERNIKAAEDLNVSQDMGWQRGHAACTARDMIVDQFKRMLDEFDSAAVLRQLTARP